MVVSEESGALSLAYDSRLYYNLTSEEIIRQLEQLLEIKTDLTREDNSDSAEMLQNENI